MKRLFFWLVVVVIIVGAAVLIYRGTGSRSPGEIVAGIAHWEKGSHASSPEGTGVTAAGQPAAGEAVAEKPAAGASGPAGSAPETAGSSTAPSKTTEKSATAGAAVANGKPLAASAAAAASGSTPAGAGSVSSTGVEGSAAVRAQARRAFWDHDYAKAVSLYRKLQADDPHDAGAWGELGNVYLAMGKRRDAASAFTHAAWKLVREGRGCPAVVRMLPWIGMVEPEQARRLSEAAGCGMPPP